MTTTPHDCYCSQGPHKETLEGHPMTTTDQNDEREAAVIARVEYRHWYNRGWVATSDLDYADAHGYTDHDGYLDGRTDRYIGLPKYHSETCAEEYGHDGCMEATR